MAKLNIKFDAKKLLGAERKASREWSLNIAEQVKQLAKRDFIPQFTGNMKKATDIDESRDGAAVVTNTQYAKFQHEAVLTHRKDRGSFAELGAVYRAKFLPDHKPKFTLFADYELGYRHFRNESQYSTKFAAKFLEGPMVIILRKSGKRELLKSFGKVFG